MSQIHNILGLITPRNKQCDFENVVAYYSIVFKATYLMVIHSKSFKLPYSLSSLNKN